MNSHDDDYDVSEYFDQHYYINAVSMRLSESYVGRVFHLPEETSFYIVASVSWSFVKLVNTMNRDDIRMVTHEDLLQRYREKL